MFSFITGMLVGSAGCLVVLSLFAINDDEDDFDDEEDFDEEEEFGDEDSFY